MKKLRTAAIALAVIALVWAGLSAYGSRQLAAREAGWRTAVATERARVASLRMPVLVEPALEGNACSLEKALMAQVAQDQGTTLAASHIAEAVRQPLGTTLPEDVAAALGRHRGDLASLREALSRPSCDWGTEWERGMDAPIPSLLGARLLANLSVLEARGSLARGDLATAASSSLQVLRFGADLGQQGTLLGSLIGMAVSDIGSETLGKLIVASRAGADWGATGDRLNRLSPVLPTIAPGFEGERLGLYGLFVLTPQNPTNLAAAMGGDASVGLLLISKALPTQFLAAWTTTELDPYLRETAATGAMEERSSWEPALQRLEQRLSKLNPMVMAMAPLGKRGRLSQATTEARARLAQIALALEANYARAKAYPDSLDALSGLETQADPLATTAAALHYSKASSGPGYRLWSVGVDGQDDGGDEKKDLLLERAASR